jgi:hypothetical protein
MKTCTFLILIVASLTYNSCGLNSKSDKKTNPGISLDLPSSWKIVEQKGDTVYSLKAASINSTAVCDIHLRKESGYNSSFEYASRVRSTLLEALYPEIMSEPYPTKLGKNEAAGFSWVHSGQDAEVMVFSVRGDFVLSVDFQKMIMDKGRPLMNDLMKAVNF